MCRLKVVLGLLIMAVAMGIIPTGLLAYPAAMDVCSSKTEWWAAYFPPVMLVNTLIASCLLLFPSLKMLKEGSLFTEKQDERIRGQIKRWLERRK